MKKNKICSICGKEYTGYGNDPWPVTLDGRCCDTCDALVVLPMRVQLLAMKEEDRRELLEGNKEYGH